MNTRNIIIKPSQPLVEIIACTTDITLNIECKADSNCELLIEHHASNVDCSLHLERNSNVIITFIGKPIGINTVTCAVFVNDVGANATINGLYDVQESSTLSFKTEQRHIAPHTTSALHMRKLVRNGAIARYNGLIYLAETAAHADASQKDMTLLLGDTAHAESVPSIEVCAHEVQCAHGSAIGRLDIQQMHYMQSRGLSAQKAESLLLHGFFAATLDTLKHTELQTRARSCLGIVNEE